MARRPTEYIASPDTATLPITLDEVEGMVQVSGAPLRNSRVLQHFLGRVVAALRMNITTMQNMSAEIDRLNARAATRFGQSTTLSPLEAVKFLSDEQRTALFQGMQADAYAATVRAREEADQAAAKARRVAPALRLSFVKLAEDPQVPPEVRARIVAALTEADRLAAEVAPASEAPATQAPVTPAPVQPVPVETPAATVTAGVESLHELFGED